MIATVQLLYKIDLKLNKLASTEHQSIPLTDKLFALNEAQIKLVKLKLDINNNYQTGFDGFRKRYQDLQNLVVTYEELPATKVDEVLGSYSSNILDLQHPYFVPVDAYVKTIKGGCERIVTVERLAKHSDVQLLLHHDHYKPSFLWQATFATVTANNFITYTANDFDILSLHISYLRYPVKIDMAGYINFDGSPSTTVDCELEAYLEDELVDLAILELALSTENAPASQSSQVRIKMGE